MDLRAVLRSPDYSLESLQAAIMAAMALKPERHHFDPGGEAQILRVMNATSG